MYTRQEWEEINAKIRQMQEISQELSERGGKNPALACNLIRVQASLKMLELNVSDVIEMRG